MFGMEKKAEEIVILEVTKTGGGLFFKYKESDLEKLNATERKQIIITLDGIKEAIMPQKRDR